MAARQEPERVTGKGQGLVKGLAVTLKHMLRPSVTQEYPDERPDLPARTRGVIGLKEANCTVCYKCARECPDWCIYIDAHKETHEPAGGGKGRSAKVLDRFAIDYALCMYCGICVEVCPFDALFWSPEFEYAEFDLVEMTHEKERLEEWTYTALPPPELEEGAEPPAEVAAPPAPRAGGGASGAPVRSAAAPLTVAPPAPPPAAPAEVPARPEPKPRVEVAIDQETYDKALAEELEKGAPERVAQGKARRAAMLAARKKAQGG